MTRGRKIDLTNLRFGKLVVIAMSDERSAGSHGQIKWHCQCDCGKSLAVIGANLRAGRTKSCGCLLGANPKQVVATRRHCLSRMDPVSRLMFFDRLERDAEQDEDDL